MCKLHTLKLYAESWNSAATFSSEVVNFNTSLLCPCSNKTFPVTVRHFQERWQESLVWFALVGVPGGWSLASLLVLGFSERNRKVDWSQLKISAARCFVLCWKPHPSGCYRRGKQTHSIFVKVSDCRQTVSFLTNALFFCTWYTRVPWDKGFIYCQVRYQPLKHKTKLAQVHF